LTRVVFVGLGIFIASGTKYPARQPPARYRRGFSVQSLLSPVRHCERSEAIHLSVREMTMIASLRSQ
jgi:hypothetical protein